MSFFVDIFVTQIFVLTLEITSMNYFSKCLLLCVFSTMVCTSLVAQSIIPEPVSRVDGKRYIYINKVDARIKKSLPLPNEGYTLTVANNKVVIRAKDEQALVWAKATLRQLTNADGRVKQTQITDYPAFKMRGFMHDTGRNFRSVEQLKKEINLFSFYKLNVFHWHLTDNPAWRIECKAYPQLNNAKYQRKGRDEGKYYTYKQIREIFQYAKERGITVIPEIDMPGHSQYFNKTFGFGMATPQGMEVLKKCIDEFCSEIPRKMCPYIHIGSDEIHIKNPKEFMQFCESTVSKHGREVLAWDPGLQASAQVITQIWRDMDQSNVSLANDPHRYIDSYMGYLNKGNPILNVYKNLLHTPCGVEKGNKKALGGILCLWNDIRIDNKEQLFAHNGMPQTLLAFAERFWGGGRWAPIGTNTDLIPSPKTLAWKKLRAFEKKTSEHQQRFLKDWDMRWAPNVDMHWRVTLPVRRGTPSDSLRWVDAWGGVIDIMALAKQNGVRVLPAMDCWMKTTILCKKDTVIRAMVGFETPPRSSRISDGIAPQGQWESGGRLFVNGHEILPPVAWKEPGKYRFHYQTWGQPANEQPYTNEQLYWMRQPVRITLHAGRNEIIMFCPRVFSNESWYGSFVICQ